MGEASGGRVVVGLDGSDVSKAALRWALRYASRTHGTVQAIIAWNFPAAYEWGPVLVGDDFEAVAHKVLSDAVDEIAGEFPEVPVEQIVAQGGPAAVLTERSHGADLLVVGSRGHGGFAGLLLGSVSQQCAHHAGCPVVVVRPEDQDEHEDQPEGQPA
ncbi:MAG TPA: universal stress protein [Micromonosporaceae bacterium]